MAALPELRDYQVDLVQRARWCYRQGIRKVLLTAPPGAGKTTIFSFVISGAAAKGYQCCVIAHRTELIDQASKRLDEYGIPHGVIMAKHPRTDPYQNVQVASIDTLRRRLNWWGKFKFIVIDEAHRSLAPTYFDFVKAHPLAWVLGVTATPFRSDGKGLGDLYDKLIVGPSIAQLIKAGYLVPPRMFAPSEPDLRGLKIYKGDYEQGALAQRVNQADLIGDIVGNWKNRARGRNTVVFAVNVAHSQHIVDQFRAQGVRSAHLDGTTPDSNRAEIIDALGTGKLEVVSNVGVLTEGTDIPSVGAIVMARPTQSRSLYIQACGRGLRPHPGKQDCIILDHAGCCMMHGPLTDPLDVTLDGIVKKKSRMVPGGASGVLKQCENCYAIVPRGSQTCPECGFLFVMDSRQVKEKGGELVEVSELSQRRMMRKEQGRAETYEDLVAVAKKRDYAPGWAKHVWNNRMKKQRRFEEMV